MTPATHALATLSELESAIARQRAAGAGMALAAAAAAATTVRARRLAGDAKALLEEATD